MRGFFESRAVRVVGVVALLVAVVVLLFLILNWYVAPTKPSERKDLVLAVAQILGGTALLWGLYFTWRTLQVNREGQITERFTRAIDQLGGTDGEGNKLFEIRLGGIYALERIAKESEDDYWPIMEILTAYVRQNASRRPEGGQAGADDAAEQESTIEGSEGESETTEAPAPDPAIQAIMTVLRRRTRSHDRGKPERLDLRETNLTRVDLRGTDLRGADLREVDLRRADLRGADLQGAYLTRADLRGADLQGANLQDADLQGADLQKAWVRVAALRRARLQGAYLQGAHLREANLQGANLWRAKLQGANLWGANLQRVYFREADLRGAVLRGGGTSLVQKQLEETLGNQYTKIPPHLKPPAHWGVKTDEQPEED